MLWPHIIRIEARCGKLELRCRGRLGAIPVRPELLDYLAEFGTAGTHPVADTVWIDNREAFRGGVAPPVPNRLSELTANRAQLDELWPEPAVLSSSATAATTTRPPDGAPEASRSGPKGKQRIAELAWQAALAILGDNARRPPSGYGRLSTLARQVNAELAKQGHHYQADSIRKVIGPSLRDWERRHPDERKPRNPGGASSG
jgi:hypothetical protein